MNDFLAQARELFPYTQAMRRDLHMHPELGFREIRTGGIVAKELESLGLEVTKGVGKTGVIGLLEGARPGPTLLLRFDMDALPILEETGAEYSSQTEGIMHACGHDGHTAIGLTVAKILHAQRGQIAGTVKFCFQPSEEGRNGEEYGGAQMMIRDGALESPRVDMTLSLHLWNDRPLGWVNVAKGPVMAGAEQFKIKLTGRGGHGAAPDTTIDPVIAAAQVVSAAQSIVARNVGPLETAVVSFTMIHSGTTFNVIPQEATLEGTIRTFDSSVREKVLARFDRIVRGVAEALGCAIEITLSQLTPALVNAEALTASVQETARRILPDAQHDDTPYLTMGAEDMAYMQEKVPGCYFFIGSANRERGLHYGHHHPKFDFDEDALARGAALMAAAAADLLP
ncbi:MAG: putative hydrolase YxeP [Anaerolineales bacterium]|nr:putative hydrolase YxeP [Anaerolineales bacterium]